MMANIEHRSGFDDHEEHDHDHDQTTNNVLVAKRNTTLLNHMVDQDHHHHHNHMDEITSPIGDHLFEFCESDLFPETLQNSEVDSSSNCCYEEQSSYPTANPSMTIDMTNYSNINTNTDMDININTNVANACNDGNDLNPTSMVGPIDPSMPNVATTMAGNNNLSIMFDNPAKDQLENDISASIDFTPSPTFSNPGHQNQYFDNNQNQEPFNIASLDNQFSLGDMMTGPLHSANQYGPDQWSTMGPPPPGIMPMLGPPIPTSFEDDCLSSVPPYLRVRPSQPHCSVMDLMLPPYLPSTNINPPFSTEISGIFSGNGLLFGNDFSHHDLDFQGDNSGLFLPDSIPRVFNCSNELQALSSDSQHLVHGGATTTPLVSEISSLDDPTFKVGKLSVEERKRKIHRYMKKRNERNFSKKIKYACRKTLADSRPRVRGRFAKNDELGEIARTSGSCNHEEDTDEDGSLFSNSIPDHQRKVGVKEEDMDSSDIFAHISGVNSLKCNYPIQSWI